MKSLYENFEFTDADVVNPDDFIQRGEYNPHRIRPWLIYNEYGTLAVVFADNMSDALDEAADAGKLAGHSLSPEDVKEWIQDGREEEIDYLGNASEPYDLTNVGNKELPIPDFSFCALFNATLAADDTQEPGG